MSQFAFCTSSTLSSTAFIRRSPCSPISSYSNLVSTTRILMPRRRARQFPCYINPSQPNCNHQENEFQSQLSSPSDQTAPPDTKELELNPNTNSSPEPQKSPPDSIWNTLTSFRNIRKALVFISLFGFAETSYLTYIKIFSSPGAICSTEGCLDVLTGPFSSFLGIPLTLFGQLSYALFAYLAIWPLAATDEERLADPANPEADPVVVSASELYTIRDAATRPLMLALSTVMVSFSTYLMGLLIFVIKSMCPYCVASAVCSATLFALTAFVGRAVPKWKPALGISAASTVAATAAAGLLYFVSMPAQLLAQPPSEPQAPPEITMKSNSDSMRIAKKLKLKDTKMYGAYWCSHCYDQKQRFGKKAFSNIQYIECDKYGVNSQFKLCRDKRIPGYPTWEIGGELYPGEIDIPELERLIDESNK